MKQRRKSRKGLDTFNIDKNLLRKIYIQKKQTIR